MKKLFNFFSKTYKHVMRSKFSHDFAKQMSKYLHDFKTMYRIIYKLDRNKRLLRKKTNVEFENFDRNVENDSNKNDDQKNDIKNE